MATRRRLPSLFPYMSHVTGRPECSKFYVLVNLTEKCDFSQKSDKHNTVYQPFMNTFIFVLERFIGPFFIKKIMLTKNWSDKSFFVFVNCGVNQAK